LAPRLQTSSGILLYVAALVLSRAEDAPPAQGLFALHCVARQEDVLAAAAEMTKRREKHTIAIVVAAATVPASVPPLEAAAAGQGLGLSDPIGYPNKACLCLNVRGMCSERSEQ
jgi:uncharacterized heparinase superfamily protein